MAKRYPESGGWENEPTRQAVSLILNDPVLYPKALNGASLGELRPLIELRLRAAGIPVCVVDWSRTGVSLALDEIRAEADR